ncbi:MerR family transcriptional regulator [Nocardia sp. NPDC058658]|uniref:DNA polymerase III subunit beta family protein n=1 Tax=Nocardia sp. NPDC058658 TaxID=3346580 RepID=UPI0036658CF4
MPDTDLITIGAFARACGLSASALRFYADAGVLTPAATDEATGYRYYAPDQSAPARLLRHLRAVDMPLPAVTALLAEPDPLRAIALLDHHLTDLDRHQETIRAAASAARAALLALRGSDSELSGGGSDRDDTEHRFDGVPRPHADDLWVSGPALAAAIDQVATATVTDPTMQVLDTILFEATAQELILTATDRYRLATRTVRPTRPTTTAWTTTINADDLRSAVSWLRRRYAVAIRPTPEGIEFDTATEDSDGSGSSAQGSGMSSSANSEFGASVDARRHCRSSTEDFPDYRAMPAALPPVRTRVVFTRADLLDALENAGAPTIALRLLPPSTVTVTPGGTFPRRGDHRVQRADVHGHDTERTLPATITGPSMTIHFTVTTLYPAVAGAVGPDVMLDLIAPDLPVLVRSADDGDLMILAMPCKPA